MIRIRIVKFLLPALLSCFGCAAFADTAPSGPRPAPMDLHTGKIDTTLLGDNEQNSPNSPPQTVEGVLVSKDATSIVIHTRRDGDVKVGVPANVVLSRDGNTNTGTLDAIQTGDRVYATVVTANGNRAIRIVSEGPDNPLISYVGIPVLGIIALGIWRIRCLPPKGAAQAQATAKAKLEREAK